MYDIVIGLEIHVEMKTKTKLFCGCSTEFGAAPNTQVCPVCLGLPGTLPQVNKEAISLAIRAGGVFGSTIQLISQFSRKNYMYPDLPKAYQITQYQEPICIGGGIEVMREGKRVMIRLERIHMEEDPGKLMHPEYEFFSLADYNRSGIPLIEIVTKPDLRSPEEAVEFLKALRTQLEFAGISDCRMEQGSLRCDANISLKEPGTEVLGTRVEIKNINSFREVQKALEKVGATAVVTNDPSVLDVAEGIVLPGVGAFADCRKGLGGYDGLFEAIEQRVVREGAPFLGICVGMQLMASMGREHGHNTEGFGWIPGEVVEFTPDDSTLKIPHMGWNELVIDQPHPVLEGITSRDHAYFVHSYHLVPEDHAQVLAHANYGGQITAVVGRDNMIGTQFHPEKSQKTGLRLIGNFLKLDFPIEKQNCSILVCTSFSGRMWADI